MALCSKDLCDHGITPRRRINSLFTPKLGAFCPVKHLSRYLWLRADSFTAATEIWARLKQRSKFQDGPTQTPILHKHSLRRHNQSPLPWLHRCGKIAGDGYAHPATPVDIQPRRSSLFRIAIAQGMYICA